jgi:hypothetical protein
MLPLRPRSGREADGALVSERARAASALAAMEVEQAGAQNQRAEQGADFGPVEYLSKLMAVEREVAMRWFIVLVACLLDPAALLLLLAASRDSAFPPNSHHQGSDIAGGNPAYGR